MSILAIYVGSVFQDFGSFLRTEIDLVDDDIRFVSDEKNSSFVTYEIEPSMYTFKDLSEALFNILQPQYPASSSVSVFEFNDNTIKNKLVVRSGFIAIRFEKKIDFYYYHGFQSTLGL